MEEHQSNIPPSGSDRRRALRHLACFPAHLQVEGGEPRTAIIRDLSVTGTMLLTRARLAVGEHVTLALYLTDDVANPGSASGVVVRCDTWGDGTSLWPYSMGIEFDRPAVEYEPEIRALAERQARAGMPR